MAIIHNANISNGMERFEEQRENLLSAEQQETVGELLGIVKPVFDSFLSPEANSDDAFEVSQRIDKLAVNLKQKGLNPKDYFLWSLLSPDSSISEAQHSYFDTEDGQIERFIRSLDSEDGQERKAA